MTDIMVKNVRLAFPTIFDAKAFPNSPDPTKYFSASFLMAPTHPQKKQLDDLIEELSKEKFGKAYKAILAAAKLKGKVFLRDGNTKPEYDGFEGMWFISARNKIRPTLLDQQKNRVEEDSGILYGGCYVNVKIGTYAYTKGDKGVGASLMGIQKVRDGDAFGGSRAADEGEFDEISAEESAEDELMQ